jgi:hypothetical protein
MFNPFIPRTSSLVTYPFTLFFNPFLFQQKPLINSPSSPKKVSFHDKVNVVLIPERKEFVEAGLQEKMWETVSFFEDNKTKVKNEINFFRKHYAHEVTAKRAFNLIYDVEGVHPANLKSR